MKTNKVTTGILAHVDAGKTTLSESILYQTGQIKKLGRVDHKDAFLDTYDLEKTRGITIYSKQAIVSLGDVELTLLDTPGHVDFSAEMERTLRVLDYAILVINGADGVQGHTLTVWKLLKRYKVPIFIFVNKMDLQGANKKDLILQIQERISENCIDFNEADEEKLWDALALCDEMLMDTYLEEGALDVTDIQLAISRRHVFPVYFGSALKNEGVQDFLDGFSMYLQVKSYPDIFGARVFKVSRNEQGERLTHLKVTGGSLEVKALLTKGHEPDEDLSDQEHQQVWEEKVDQIRIYSGESYTSVLEVAPGTICALTGLSKAKPGDGLGFEGQGDSPALTPVLSYKVIFPKDVNSYTVLKNLQLLEEEEPNLNVVWNEDLAEIHLQVMGEIQIEVLKSTISERFNWEVSFDKGSLVYRETIKSAVVGVGHFEPLKHYAEVHLLMEALENNQGMIFETNCSEDLMDRHWQRLVLSHLNERKHIGVLTGSVITDMKVTLVAGKGHNKHTEGGDFREATFRALRQGLMTAECILLEPVYEFTLEVPKELLGKAISDIERMQGRYDDPLIDLEQAMIKGTAPVAKMMHYAAVVMAYSKGQGRLSLSLKGYEPCHNSQEVIDATGYDPEKDMNNPSGSVFCSKGTAYGVPWQEAEKHMHVSSGLRLNAKTQSPPSHEGYRQRGIGSGSQNDQELEAIFVKTYGEQKDRRRQGGSGIFEQVHKSSAVRTADNSKQTYLLVDGYNIIFTWEKLKVLAAQNLDTARFRLMDILCNYQGQTGDTIILVFDAYRVAGGRGETMPYHNIHVVYTKEMETADQYIERLVDTIRPDYEVTVATSDVVEQVIILGKGARRLSAEAFQAEIDSKEAGMKDHYMAKSEDKKHRPFEKFLK